MKYFIIAGEASGDLHGSNLVKHLRLEDPQAEMQAWGGDLMQAQDAKVLKHYRELAYMGFWEVAKNIGTILGNFKVCKKQISEFNPDVVILIDFPGFNLRMAKWAKEKGFKVFYYISPQVWAWKSSRVKDIRKYVDQMYVILPFEKAFYQKWNYDVQYVGHPLLDAIGSRTPDADFKKKNGLTEAPIVALLPGSRRQEIYEVLPVMCNMANDFPSYQFVIAGLSNQDETLYRQAMDAPNIKLVFDKTYDLLEHAEAALVTSGTATLETALFEVPQVVCYKGGKISYLLARQLVDVKYISLVNLIMDKTLVRELIQDGLNLDNLKQALREILDPVHADGLKQSYRELKDMLGNEGASSRAAKGMVSFLRSTL